MLLDEILAPHSAMHEAYMFVETVVSEQRARFETQPRWWDDRPVAWRTATWNDLREIARRMIVLGMELAERIDEDERVHLDLLDSAWRYRARAHYVARRHGWPITALVRADPVTCPRCTGIGHWSSFLFDDVIEETCEMCAGTGMVPRCRREADRIALFVMGLGVDLDFIYTGRPAPFNAEDMWYAWRVTVVEAEA
jgi:hypothetical protein